MKTVCDMNMCTACKACINICKKDSISISDNLKNVNAVIDEEKCIHCGLCEKVCQVKSPLPLQEPITWYQGWNTNSGERKKSSSGAFAYSLSMQMINDGGYVVSCHFHKGEFKYYVTNTILDLDGFRESKYVKSDPKDVYSAIKKLLLEGDKILFIGLPCHVAGLKKYLGREYENLITVDLICHGSPSPKLLDMFLNQYGYNLSSINKIHFRQKGNFRLICDVAVNKEASIKNISFTEPSIRDRYTIAFLYGLIYTENCYHCAYAGVGRVSDITLGDSWGSDLEETERSKGISLAMCQTEKGLSLLKRCSLELHAVDIDKAIAANHQLREPSPLSERRDVFFRAIEKGTDFNHAVNKSFPMHCFRLDLKNFLIKSKFLKS